MEDLRSRILEDEDAVSQIDAATAYRALLSSLKTSRGRGTSKRQRQEDTGEGNGEEKPRKKSAVPVTDENDEDSEHDEQSEGNDEVPAEQEEIQDLQSDDDSSQAKNEFKNHVEHVLSKEELANLSKPSTEFGTKTAAAGMTNATWVTNRSSFPEFSPRLSEYNLKSRLAMQWKLSMKGDYGDFGSEQQCQFFALCNSYCDIFHSRKSSLVTKKGASEIMDAYLLHSLNHILKTRDLVSLNNEELSKQAADSAAYDVPRDQGFTRPKVLFLLPFRSVALKLIKRLIYLTPRSQRATVDRRRKFFKEYGTEDEPPDNSKPPDYQALFNGNSDDRFVCGVKFSKKNIYLYTDSYSSDILVASPLGLITGGAETGDMDFLSSLEIVIVDCADVILMQNWMHVVDIFGKLNKLPSSQHDTDIMRVREWFLNGHAQYYRQTIFLSSFSDPAINALFLRSCFNYQGKVMLQCKHEGVLSSILLQVRQVFERFDCLSITEVDDARFNFFVKQVYPRLKESLEGGYLVVVRSYFDFVRIRNFLKSESASFCLLGEYTKESDISRSRSWFYHGRRKIMLYTERCHFYRRFKIRGAREIVFYSLPDHANFYSELANMLEGVESPSCTASFCQFDKPQLERIVGSSRAKKMLSSKNKTFMFC